MSSLRASGMIHRGPRFEFARLLASWLVQLNSISLAPGSAVEKKAKKRGQNRKNIVEWREPTGGLGYLSFRVARRFLSCFPQSGAWSQARIQWKWLPTSSSGGWRRIPSLFGMPIVLAFAVCSHNLVSRDRKIGMQCVYNTMPDYCFRCRGIYPWFSQNYFRLPW